jgi:hypothetical protein
MPAGLNGFLRISKGVKKLAPFKELFRPCKCSRGLRICARINELLNSLLLQSLAPTSKHLAGGQAFNSRNIKES